MRGSLHSPIWSQKGIAHSLPIHKGVADGDELLGGTKYLSSTRFDLGLFSYYLRFEISKAPTSNRPDSVDIAKCFSQPKEN